MGMQALTNKDVTKAEVIYDKKCKILGAKNVTRLETIDGCSYTVKKAVLIAKKTLSLPVKTEYYIPAQ
jgi:hypothetical protein